MKWCVASFVALTGCIASDPTCDVDDVAVWKALPTDAAPRAQRGFVHAWTGRELLVWGGETTSFEGEWDHAIGTGARFDPTEGSWTPMSTVGAPSGRRNASAVWTGTELIVWGGEDATGDLADGARYNPELDRWTPMSSAGAPDSRADALAVWTGTEMLVVGGYYAALYALRLDDGALYNPATDTWRPLPRAERPNGELMRSADDARAVWTGREVVFWGARFESVGQNGYARGWIFDPTADAWRTMSRTNEPTRRSPAVLAMHDGKVLVWGGDDLYRERSTGALYDVATDTWSSLPTVEVPAKEGALLAGDRLIVSPEPGGHGWVVDPFAGTTSPLPFRGTHGWTPLAWSSDAALTWMKSAVPRGDRLGAELRLCP